MKPPVDVKSGDVQGDAQPAHEAEGDHDGHVNGGLGQVGYGSAVHPVCQCSEFFQIRLWLEAAVIGDAVRQIDAAHIAQLDELLALWAERTRTGQPWADLDKRFHDILYQTLDNRTLLKLNEVFWLAYDKLDIAGIHQADPAEELGDHQAIFEAIKSGDPELTRQRLLANFTHFQQRIERGIKVEQE